MHFVLPTSRFAASSPPAPASGTAARKTTDDKRSGQVYSSQRLRRFLLSLSLSLSLPSVLGIPVLLCCPCHWRSWIRKLGILFVTTGAAGAEGRGEGRRKRDRRGFFFPSRWRAITLALMGCFACLHPRKRESKSRIRDRDGAPSSSGFRGDSSVIKNKASSPSEKKSNSAHSFAFRHLAIATQNFKEANLIGEGGFGRVYKGVLDSTSQEVAIKQLRRDGLQGNKEFLVEVLMLVLLRHPNLVSLIGYCAEGDERLLVYEYMPKGSLADHLFDPLPDKLPLDWNTRIKIAVGIAQGLAYLHEVANPPVIYRDMKAANVLLDNDFNPKLSDFGLARVGPVGDNTHVSTRVMGTFGYCAPDYAMSGKLSLKSDVYSFGVLLLELITGRRVYDASKTVAEQKLLIWSRPFLSDKRKYNQLADPLLHGRFPLRPFQQLIAVVLTCIQEQPRVRPVMADVVVAVDYVASQPYISEPDLPKTMISHPPSSSLSVTTPSRDIIARSDLSFGRM